MNRCTAFFISDRTGITAETLGLSLISQFEEIQFTQITLPFVDTHERAKNALERFEQAHKNDGRRPVVFATIISEDVRAIVSKADVHLVEFFNTFIPNLEKELSSPSAHKVGKIHGVKNTESYNTRIEAVNYALAYDDGAKTDSYESADVILVGVSRTGKTPTSIYLAMQYGLRAANYPITEEDMDHSNLPKLLKPYKKKLFGLTIDPKRLQAIREQRRPNSSYSSLKQCQKEVRVVEAIFKQENIPYLGATNLSIEELATKLMVIAGLIRNFR